jgi:predicted acyltransferase
MALGGLLTVLAERRLHTAKAGIGIAAAAVLAVLATAAHQGWIISKNLGTLPWCLYVCALSVALYTLLRVLEKHGKTGWFKPFSPAGTATLTVYMIPYLFVALWIFIQPSIPEWLSGWVGIGKCALYTAVCLGIAWGLTKLGVKLKI